jgi:hypothetical protein
MSDRGSERRGKNRFSDEGLRNASGGRRDHMAKDALKTANWLCAGEAPEQRRPSHDVRREISGPTYDIEHDAPRWFEHPQDPAARLIISNAPRALPLTDQVEHDPEFEGREAAFEEVIRKAMSFPGRFVDRRLVGRKYRSGALFEHDSYRHHPKDPPISEEAWARGF